MNEDRLRKGFDALTPDAQTRARMAESIAVRRQDMPRRKKGRAIAIAVLCLCLVIGLPALAVNIPSVHRAMLSVPGIGSLYVKVAGSLAFLLGPSRWESEDAGIRMAFLGTTEEDGQILAYFSLEDVEADRLSRSVELYRSVLYSAYLSLEGLTDGTGNVYKSSGISYGFLGFDEETRRAIYVVGNWDGREVHGRKVQISIPSLLLNREEIDHLPITLESGISGNEVMYLQEGDWAGYGSNGKDLEAPFPVLKPGEKPQQLTDFVWISAAGFVDGLYHIQLRYEEGVDNHGDLWMTNTAGEKVPSGGVTGIHFGYDAETGSPCWGRAYREYIFDIEPEELDGCDIYGYFVGDGLYIEGDWSLLFQMDPEDILSEEDEVMVRRMHEEQGI